MAPEDESDLGEADGVCDFVPAVMARSVDDAERYRELLDDHDIPAVLGTDEELDDLDMEEADRVLARRRGMTHGVPVLVPESMLDEASEVISDRETFGGGFDDEEDEYDDEDDDDGISPSELVLDDEDDDLVVEDDDDEDEDDDELFGGLDDDLDDDVF